MGYFTFSVAPYFGPGGFYVCQVIIGVGKLIQYKVFAGSGFCFCIIAAGFDTVE